MQRQGNTQRRGGKIAASESVNLKSNMKHINIHALKIQPKKQQCLRVTRNALSSWTATNNCGVEEATKPSETTRLWEKYCKKPFPWGWD